MKKRYKYIWIKRHWRKASWYVNALSRVKGHWRRKRGYRV